MYCWNCAHVIKDGEKKCSSCGMSTKWKKNTNINYCPNCGKSVLKKEKCKYCGFDLVSKKAIPKENILEENALNLQEKRSITFSPKTEDDWNQNKKVSLSKSNQKKGIFLLLFIVAVLLMLIGIFILFNQANSNSSNQENMQLYDSNNNIEEGTEEEIYTVDSVKKTTAKITTKKVTTTKATTTAVPKNHRYELIQSAVGWEEANNRAIASGGRLAEVHSEEDWNKLISAVSNTDVYFIWLGAKRSDDFSTMYWNSGEEVNSNWSHWYTNEPSYVDAANPSVVESYLMLWYLKDSGWSLNDANSSAVLNTYKEYRIGYVVEYDY